MIYAGFWRRFCAVMIDGLILLIPSFAAGYAVPIAGPVLISFLYAPFFTSSMMQATPGKAIMGMAVVDENGNTLTLKAAIIRELARYLSVLCICIGYLMNLFTAKRQTLHDIIAQTVVVMKTPPDVNYFQVWLGEIKKLSGDAAASEEIIKTTPNTNAAKAIEDLHKLFQSGAITQAEYESKKTELLNKI